MVQTPGVVRVIGPANAGDGAASSTPSARARTLILIVPSFTSRFLATIDAASLNARTVAPGSLAEGPGARIWPVGARLWHFSADLPCSAVGRALFSTTPRGPSRPATGHPGGWSRTTNSSSSSDVCRSDDLIQVVTGSCAGSRFRQGPGLGSDRAPRGCQRRTHCRRGRSGEDSAGARTGARVGWGDPVSSVAVSGRGSRSIVAGEASWERLADGRLLLSLMGLPQDVPIVQRSGRGPFKAETRVRFPVGTPSFAQIPCDSPENGRHRAVAANV